MSEEYPNIQLFAKMISEIIIQDLSDIVSKNVKEEFKKERKKNKKLLKNNEKKKNSK